tara:strand:- start:1306 stop:2643 length:1338 start_codon:yes stop_codon:yes gene_type:complete
MRSGELDLLESALEQAKARGADDAEALISISRSTAVACRDAAVEHSQFSESSGLSIRVFIDGRSGSVSSSDINERGLGELIDRAVAVAKASPRDPFAGLVSSDDLALNTEKDLQIYDATTLDAEALKEMAMETEAAALAVHGVRKSTGASASWNQGFSALATTNGFLGSQRGSGFNLGCGAIVKTNSGMETDAYSSGKVFLEDMESAASVGEAAGARAVSRIKGTSVRSGRFPVVFDARISNSLLGHFAGATMGNSVAMGTSFLKDKKEERVFSAGISIIDDPLRLRGTQSRCFDGEGVATQPLTLVEDGVLQHWLLDQASARQLNLPIQGNAARSGSGTRPGASNLFLAAGRMSPEELMSDIRYGLLITKLMGQGVNGLTGHYSRGAEGFLIENGEISGAVKEITIAGNLLEMYLNLTAANDLQFRRGMDAPTVRVEGMFVAGN